ncbi:hypothetical protein QYM36_014865 [Artemia franciscana]|uniref:Uncharacterized protein n=1 Tax=Artemia franciscana TaxID=6661 RepID=A0AA88HJT8_ARTSF|nr:hypothetical protein QYM36_014865 [Artemia franciscana]
MEPKKKKSYGEIYKDYRKSLKEKNPDYLAKKKNDHKGLAIQYHTKDFWNKVAYFVIQMKIHYIWQNRCGECANGEKVTVDIELDKKITWRQCMNVDEISNDGKKRSSLKNIVEKGNAKDIPGIECEIIWTDSPSSEFKNKFTVQFLKKLSEEHNVPFFWKYFATSHGKGVVSGIRGNAKSLVRRSVISKGFNAMVVQSYNDFACAANGLVNKQLSIIFHRNRLISIETVMTCERYGTNNTLSMVTPKSAEVNDSLAIGGWYVIKYNDEEFPRKVISKIGDEYEVSVLHIAGEKTF